MKVFVVHARHSNKRGHNPFLVQPANTFYAFKILKRTVIQGGYKCTPLYKADRAYSF